MIFKKIKLYIDTIRCLKPIQVYYQLYYRLKGYFFSNLKYSNDYREVNYLYWDNYLIPKNSYLGNKTFIFLNQKKVFRNEIDWNFIGNGKLWSYNLNYFDFLNQNNLKKETSINLLFDYYQNYPKILVGKDPYPTSNRIINTVKFILKYRIDQKLILKGVKEDAERLCANIEYHILGNHILENGFALLFASCLFKSSKFAKISKEILFSELDEQILDDGGHFELSPMYHIHILNRLLDCIYLIKENSLTDYNKLLNFLIVKSSVMVSWLRNIIFSNGDFPLLNDSSKGIYFKPKTILDYAKEMSINEKKIELSDSGYRFFKKNRYELLIDIGNIGPIYQAGHAHADTFNFILHVDNKPIIVDPGVSTYEDGPIRDLERSTKFHNTVEINNYNSSEIWKTFRVAKRANVNILKDTSDEVVANHDGYYKSFGSFHERKFIINDSEIQIKDKINNDVEAIAYFHFHKDCDFKINKYNQIIIHNGIIIEFKGHDSIQEYFYMRSYGFNNLKSSKKIGVFFKNELTAKIIL